MDDLDEDFWAQVVVNPLDDNGSAKDYAIRTAADFVQSNQVDPRALDFVDLVLCILRKDLGVGGYPKAEIIKDLQ